MRPTAAFLILMACLTGSALAETQQATPRQQQTMATTEANANQQCPPAAPDPASSDINSTAPQNQVEYGGGG